MKKIVLLLFFCSSISLIAQITNKGEPISWNLAEKSTLTPIFLPEVNIQKIKAQDIIDEKNPAIPYRVGIPYRVNVGLHNAGSWTQLSNGDRIWRILFSSKDAVHLSVVFNKFNLPKGGKIYLYNDERTDLLGAYTEIQNNKEESLGTWFVNGDRLWIEYYEPKEVKGKGKLNISSVIHGYRLGHSYQKGYLTNEEKALNGSGDCNHDVDCPIGADYEATKNVLKKSVAFLSMGNGFICSGGLVNNTAQDKKPFFLTANHCYFDNSGEASNPANYSMRFNWISPNPVCAATTDSTDGPTNFIMTGATLRAKNPNSDFMLVEINNPIPSSWDVVYAGWDKSDTNPTMEVGIHHPHGDIMKVCRDDTGAVKMTNAGAQTWDITGAGNGWEIGVTEGGSSGSPLFDQNGHVIGQLYGGGAACNGTIDNDLHDYYGRFAVSWNAGGSSSNQLKNWLDPSGTFTQDVIGSIENVLAVNNPVLNKKNITIYPNPTSRSIQVKTTGLTGNLYYEVYNILGQVMLSSKLENKAINLSKLPNDIYFIRVTELDTNKTLTKKIIVDK